MNKERRKAINEAGELLARVKEILETARDEEQDYFDNMPESFQGGEKGDNAQTAIGELDNAINSIEEAESSIGFIE